MDTAATRALPARPRHHLTWDGSRLELAACRAGLRTRVVLYRDGEPLADETGSVRVLLPAPDIRSTADRDASAADVDASPKVLALAVLPGVLSSAFLMIPRGPLATGPESGPASDEAGDDELPELPKGLAGLVGFARAERHRFEPAPGTFAARMLAFQRAHPTLYASRHVVLAAGKVLLGVLGVALFFQLVLSRVVGWVVERLPSIDWPQIPWPDIDLPSLPLPDIPWPDIDLPDLALPYWLQAVLATAKYWVPILVAIGIAVEEVRRRRRRQSLPPAADRPEPDGSTSATEEERAHR